MPVSKFLPTGQDRYRGNVPINWFFAKDDEKGPILLRTPGAGLFSATTAPAGIAVRGMKVMGDYLYVVVQTTQSTSTVYQVDKVGNYLSIGTIGTGIGNLNIVVNGGHTQIEFLDGVNGYVYDTYPKSWVRATGYLAGIYVQPTTANQLFYLCTAAGTSDVTEPTWPTTIGATVNDNGVIWQCVSGVPYFAEITDPNFLGGGSGCYQDGYLIYAKPNTREWGVSNLNDFTTYDGNGQSTKEGGDDNIAAVLTSHLNVWLMGEKTIEIYYDAGTPAVMPFVRLSGTFIEKGVIAPRSAVIGDDTVWWLTNEKQVVVAAGYQPKRISTDQMEREISDYPTVADAIGWFQVDEGHSFYWLTFPTANVTWVFDDKTKSWHKRSTYPKNGRHLANCYAYFDGKHLVGSSGSSAIYKLDTEIFTDAGQPIRRVVQSREFRNGGERLSFPDLQFVFNHGLGTGSSTITNDAMLSWSKDGGNTFNCQRRSSMGDFGQYGYRTIFKKLGSDYQRIYQLETTNPACGDLLEVDEMT